MKTLALRTSTSLTANTRTTRTSRPSWTASTGSCRTWTRSWTTCSPAAPSFWWEINFLLFFSPPVFSVDRRPSWDLSEWVRETNSCMNVIGVYWRRQKKSDYFGAFYRPDKRLKVPWHATRCGVISRYTLACTVWLAITLTPGGMSWDLLRQTGI